MQISDSTNESVILEEVVLEMCAVDGGRCFRTHVFPELLLDKQNYTISAITSNRYGTSDASAMSVTVEECSSSTQNGKLYIDHM